VVPPEVASRAAARDAARKARDFATADRLRDELVGEGWTLEDGPDGTVIR
jgi:cysteinyl-tRNA synthetase